MTLLDRIVKTFLPRETQFFDLLEKGATCAAKAGALMEELGAASSEAARGALVLRLRDVEHEADGVIHEVYDALNRTFVTPIDRSDIYSLATQLEEIVDLAHATATQVDVHAMSDLPAGSRELGRLIAQATVEVQAAVSKLRGMKDLEQVRAHCQQMSRLEHDGDTVFRTEIGKLFKSDVTAVRLIQHKEFLEGLERTLDACDHTGGALTAIVIKNG